MINCILFLKIRLLTNWLLIVAAFKLYVVILLLLDISYVYATKLAAGILLIVLTVTLLVVIPVLGIPVILEQSLYGSGLDVKYIVNKRGVRSAYKMLRFF